MFLMLLLLLMPSVGASTQECFLGVENSAVSFSWLATLSPGKLDTMVWPYLPEQGSTKLLSPLSEITEIPISHGNFSPKFTRFKSNHMDF